MKGMTIKTTAELRSKMQDVIDLFDATTEVSPDELKLLDGMTAVNQGVGLSTVFATVGYADEAITAEGLVTDGKISTALLDYDTSLVVDGKIAAATIVADTDSQRFVLDTDSPFAPVLATETTLVVDATAGAVVINLPEVSTVPGKTFFIYKHDASANNLTINCGGTDTFIGTGGGGAAVVLTATTDFVSIQAVTNGGLIVGWLLKDAQITP